MKGCSVLIKRETICKTVHNMDVMFPFWNYPFFSNYRLHFGIFPPPNHRRHYRRVVTVMKSFAGCLCVLKHGCKIDSAFNLKRCSILLKWAPTVKWFRVGMFLFSTSGEIVLSFGVVCSILGSFRHLRHRHAVCCHSREKPCRSFSEEQGKKK